MTMKLSRAMTAVAIITMVIGGFSSVAFAQTKSPQESYDPLTKLGKLQKTVTFFDYKGDISCDGKSDKTTPTYSECVRDRLLITTGRIVQVVLGFLGVIFLILTIYAGYLWLTAGGNAEQVTKAQTFLRNGIIGLLITISSYVASAFVINQLTSSISAG